MTTVWVLLIVNILCAAALLWNRWWWAEEADTGLSGAERNRERRRRRAWAARCTLLAPLWGPLLGAVTALMLLGIFVAGLLIDGVEKLWDDAHLPADPPPVPSPRDEGPFRTNCP